jgi:hypothetical protein
MKHTETNVLQLLLDTIALKFAIGLHKLVAMIFAMRFEIIMQRAVGNEHCCLIENTLIITVLHRVFISRQCWR